MEKIQFEFDTENKVPLPDDCMRKISSYLSFGKEMGLRKVSKEFKELIDNNQDSNKKEVKWKLIRKNYSRFNYGIGREISVSKGQSTFVPLKELLESANKYIFKDFYITIEMPKNIKDEDLTILGKEEYKQLKGRIFLDISECKYITDKAFKNLEGIYGLDISNSLERICGNLDRPRITGEGFKYLKTIRKLKMRHCWQIAEKKLSNLTEIQDLDITLNAKITGEVFKNLKTIRKLKMRYCFGITDENLSNLTEINDLDISSSCITGEVFKNLNKIQKLNLTHCHQIKDEAIPYLIKIPELKRDYNYSLNNNTFIGKLNEAKRNQAQQNQSLSIK